MKCTSKIDLELEFMRMASNLSIYSAIISFIYYINFLGLMVKKRGDISYTPDFIWAYIPTDTFESTYKIARRCRISHYVVARLLQELLEQDKVRVVVRSSRVQKIKYWKLKNAGTNNKTENNTLEVQSIQ